MLSEALHGAQVETGLLHVDPSDGREYENDALALQRVASVRAPEHDGCDEQADLVDLASPDAAFLHFSHFMQSEAGYDGGNLKVSINGGDFAAVPNEAFDHNPHSGEFAAGPEVPLPVPDPTGLTGNNTNPMAGQVAWTGSDQGEATGSWGVSVVDFETLGAVAGDLRQPAGGTVAAGVGHAGAHRSSSSA